MSNISCLEIAYIDFSHKYIPSRLNGIKLSSLKLEKPVLMIKYVSIRPNIFEQEVKFNSNYSYYEGKIFKISNAVYIGQKYDPPISNFLVKEFGLGTYGRYVRSVNGKFYSLRSDSIVILHLGNANEVKFEWIE